MYSLYSLVRKFNFSVDSSCRERCNVYRQCGPCCMKCYEKLTLPLAVFFLSAPTAASHLNGLESLLSSETQIAIQKIFLGKKFILLFESYYNPKIKDNKKSANSKKNTWLKNTKVYAVIGVRN